MHRETGLTNSADVMNLLLIIGIMVTLMLVLVLRKRKKAGKTGGTDYKAFFIMGIAFLPTGVVMMFMYFLTETPFEIGLPLVALGLIYILIGLANRDKWKKAN
jgi:LPXTG-motif cell wall-anchored protein